MNAANWHETIEILSKMGLQVRIKHLRRFKVKERYAGSLATLGEFKRMSGPEYAVAPSDVYEVASRGGRTVCQILVVGDDQTPPLVEASVECHKGDSYNKRIGRTKALGRALHELKTAHPLLVATYMTLGQPVGGTSTTGPL